MLVNVLVAIICIAPVFILVFKLRSEEKDQRVDYILSGAVSRTKYFAGHVVMGFAASVVMPFIAATGMWATGRIMMDEPIAFHTMLRAMMVYVPALWVMLGLAVLLIGLLPKAVMLCWTYFAYIFVAGFFGDLLGMPEWSLRLSPVGFVPRLPLDEVNARTLLALSAIALCLMALGFIFYRRRDVVS